MNKPADNSSNTTTHTDDLSATAQEVPVHNSAPDPYFRQSKLTHCITTDHPNHLSNQAAAIEISALKKSYGLKPVLRRIDLSLEQGQRMALLGANGTGKTTLLRILACLTRPSSGSVTIAGFDSTRDAQQIRRLIGFVAHQPYLYEELTALENLQFFGRMYGIERINERAHELLRRVGLERRSQDRVSSFSRGQMQRLSWARAVLHLPHLLLLDEADTGLDQEGHGMIDGLLAEHISYGGSILFTTHQLERALSLSDTIAILAHGRVAYHKATAELALTELNQIYQEVTR